MTQAVLKNQVTKLDIATGIEKDARTRIATQLSDTLASAYRVMVNTQMLHWNVQGPLFYSVHKLTETQYSNLFAAIDKIAERIRALGFPAPKSVTELFDGNKLEDMDGSADLETQIAGLATMNERFTAQMRDAIDYAEKSKDVTTADLLTTLTATHEQNAWMLRATIAPSDARDDYREAV